MQMKVGIMRNKPRHRAHFFALMLRDYYALGYGRERGIVGRFGAGVRASLQAVLDTYR